MKKHIEYILFLLVATLVSGCSENLNPCGLSPATLEHFHHLDSIMDVPEIAEMHREWMKSNFDEPSILDATNETYRFILSSSNYSKVVRIEVQNDHGSATVKEYNGTPGDPNLVPLVRQFQLPDSTWEDLTGQLEALHFWTYPNPPERRVLHGTSWSLSAYKPIMNECTSMHYQSLSTSYTSDDPAFMAMCMLFDEL